MSFKKITDYFEEQFIYDGYAVNRGKWQGLDTQRTPQYTTIELHNQKLEMDMNHSLEHLRLEIKPNLPWADDHFEKERIGGLPLNPGNEFRNWPLYRVNPKNDVHRNHAVFTHTYMERIWPKKAGVFHTHQKSHGIRYELGDLNDLIRHLGEQPLSRQAYLPIWFPEDTGVLHGGRVPCSLGYHFLARKVINDWVLDCYYDIRSCDYIRHFRDDVYMAIRLSQYVMAEVNKSALSEKPPFDKPGNLYMSMHNFHIFQSDLKLFTND